ncbi:Cap-specific mRNA (nucleoside-2'-O-)-methyltransferase 1 [Orchesella cincta]|uniref:Cap-specific mRNA (nucleoside-2'-O-)-methyltransferase 1 n=1 Tax=Orchesella cincta TaxID=48709 RepID=A0A1D2NEC9_ORCCI|nr:Cap-specific mRNA (nucleoside-2'-O-)-methyltransferase 1 [Orchesella cincta]
MADDTARRSAALASAKVPDSVKNEIINIAQEEFPKKIAVLQLGGKYQNKYKKELRPETYGFKNNNDLLKTIKQVVLHHDEMLALWFLTYNPTAVVEQVEEVQMDDTPMEIEGGNGEVVEPEEIDENNHSNNEQNAEQNAAAGANIVVLEDTEEAEMKAPDAPAARPRLPNLPPPSPSVSSVASSNASGTTRSRRLPPPPPSMDWSYGSKSILGKRQGSILGPDAKRLQLDEDMESVCSVDESVPQQDRRKLETDRRRVKYIPSFRDQDMLTYDSLILGKKMGVVEPATYVDTTFCQREVLERLMEVKYEIRKVGGPAYQELQQRLNDYANPPVIFQFNSAYLYANIDALTGFALTNPCARNGESIVGENELLYAVDIHGGPGGFVEYMLTKKQWEAKVYGYTFKEEPYNYQLTATGHFPKESFEQWLGLDGKRGDGSIYKPNFVEQFCRFVKRNTGGNFNGGVHVVVADGSEMTPGLDEDRKELRCKPLILAEACIAMKVLREGGTFVLRLYDIFTPYTAGLVYLMYKAFETCTIIRPETCHQGSAERFLVCKNYRGGKICTEISNYLNLCHSMDHGCHVNHKFPNDQQAEIVELVPVEQIRSSDRFYDYIYESNCIIGRIQLEETHALCRALQFRHDGRIVAQRKNDMRVKCSETWNCPRRLRQEPRYASLSPELFLSKLLRPYPENVLNRTEREGEVVLTYPVMDRDFANPQEWHFVSVGRDRGFYMGRGGDKVYRFSGGKWKLVQDEMDIADQTLVYGDIVDEITQYEGKQITQTAFHIIDGMVLGGKDIRNLSYRERTEMCTKFAMSMCKPSLTNLVLVRAKKPQEATRLEPSLIAVHKEQVKGRGDRKKRPLAPVDISDAKSAAYAHTGYLFMRTTKTNEVNADFITTMQNRLYWKLDEGMDRNPSAPAATRPSDPRVASNTSVDSPSLVQHIKSVSPQPNAAK